MSCSVRGCSQQVFGSETLCYFHRKQAFNRIPKEDRGYYLNHKELAIVNKNTSLTVDQLELFRKYLPVARAMARNFASRYSRGTLTFDDYYQSCAVRLWNMILFGEVKVSLNPKAYLIKAFICENANLLREQFSSSKTTVCVHTGIQGSDLEECVMLSTRDIQLNRILTGLLNRMDEIDRFIVHHHLYPIDHQVMAGRKIAHLFKLSQPAVHYRIKKIVKKLRVKLEFYGDLNYWKRED